MSALTKFAFATLFALALPDASQARIKVVGAESVYGDLVRQIGGPEVEVTSIMSSPDQDPHLFEADPSTARALGSAKIVISNGVDYDPWMAKLLKADAGAGRAEIVVADVARKKAGDNPHLWYDPAAMTVLARAIATGLAASDSGHAAEFATNLGAFEASLQPVRDKIAAMRARYAGMPVTATEPLFGYMADALGLDMRNKPFQLAVMNNTEPSASEVAAFEDDLRNRKVKVMIHNSQVDDQAVRRLVRIAADNKVPVVGISETEPAGQTYQSWMMGQLDALDRALAGSQP